MNTDYMRYVGKRNSKAVDAIGKKLRGEGRNKKEYYYATLKEGYYFSCTDENLPMNERGEIYSDNFVKFKEMLRSITLFLSLSLKQRRSQKRLLRGLKRDFRRKQRKKILLSSHPRDSESQKKTKKVFQLKRP